MKNTIKLILLFLVMSVITFILGSLGLILVITEGGKTILGWLTLLTGYGLFIVFSYLVYILEMER